MREATLVWKVAPTNRNSSAFLLHTSKIFFNIELFSIFSQTFLVLIFATKIKTMLLKQLAVDQLSKKYCVCYVSEHLKYCSQINEYWLNKNVCLNIVIQFKVYSERQISEKLFHGCFNLLSEFVTRNLLKESRQRNIFFIFSFWCLTWDLKSGLMSNKGAHYLLDYGDL